ncbi:MAG TPA: aromatic ring-hydroxylating dioxygenase subunit alpha [Candidatus Limnocylindria bacterium]|jgi:choline monooxygenase|nr:aromatic ring-hydroxylating dioxygenase subunit alpha [Candidatus Limnocylindria bacterium]
MNEPESVDSEFTIDPDIRVARTLPARVYSDPTLFRAQQGRVFARTWQYAAHDDVVKVAGQVYPFTLLPGALGEPLLLTRDGQDKVHALSNVCTHRGTLVVDGAGHEQQLRCRYHGRRFALDGRFHSMPEFEGTKDFPSASDDLPHVALGTWQRFLMVSLAPAMTFDDIVAPMRARLGHLPFDQLVFDASGVRDYVVNANWALYVDNYLEGFHIPYVHNSLAAVIDYGAYAVELERYAVLQVAIAKPGETALGAPGSHPDTGKRVAAYYYWLFPTTMFNVYPWGVSVNVVVPLAVDRTRVSFLPFVWDAGKREQGAGGGLDRVEREDEAIVEAVQRGVRSRLYERGRYSATREGGVHHFHRLLAEFMHP